MRSLFWIVAAGLLGAVGVSMALAGSEDTPAAAATRKRLAKEKISIDVKDLRTQDIFKDIELQLNDKVRFKFDTVGGVSLNTKLTFKCKEDTAEKVLDAFCTKFDFGYIVISKKGDRYDGWILIKKGKERGYEAGKEPKKSSLNLSPAPLTPQNQVLRLARKQ